MGLAQARPNNKIHCFTGNFSTQTMHINYLNLIFHYLMTLPLLDACLERGLHLFLLMLTNFWLSLTSQTLLFGSANCFQYSYLIYAISVAVEMEGV